MEAVVATNDTPAVGQEWSGGVYVGITVDNGQPAHLIVLPEEFNGTWAKAGAWAAKQDAVLPSRFDLLVMFQQRAALKIDDGWYWSAESHHEDAEYAWCQTFGTGGQGSDHKGINDRARAVRRLVVIK
jgi:hypothetical protein